MSNIEYIVKELATKATKKFINRESSEHNFMTETEHEDKKEGVQLYELGYHLVPSLSEDDLALRVSDLQKKITSMGGKIHSEGAPQSFILAYTMRRLRGGRWDKYDSSFFGWVRFEVAPESLEELKNELEHSEFVIRHLLIKLDPEALVVPKPRAPRPVETGEVEVEPKELEKKHDVEEKTEVVEEELDKQIEELIK